MMRDWRSLLRAGVLSLALAACLALSGTAQAADAPGAATGTDAALTGAAGTGVAGAAAAGADAAADTAGGRSEPLPDELEGIGVEEHLNAQLPLDLVFTDEAGRTVRLGEYFTPNKPVILNLVYFTCPMLCTLVLNGVTEGMKGLSWDLGEEYVNVTVSIDPAETPDLARAKKQSYLEEYGRPGGEASWHFLIGQQESITALAEAVGFKYRFDPETREFIHTAATFVCTPDGRVARYLYGIEYEQQTLKMALLEASSGKIGSTIDRLILYCYHYDAESGRYAPMARRIMKIGGGLTAAVLLVLLLSLWKREGRRRPAIAAGLSLLGLLSGTARAGEEPSFWMPIQGSSSAPQVDWIFNFILIISIVFFLLIVSLMVVFAVRYRRRPGLEAQKSPTHNTRLEVAWTVIPLILVTFIFYYGFKGFLDLNTPPQNSYEVLVTAQKWNWQFTYPNGHTDGTLHAPVDTPVRLVLSSEDVIHSLYIPAFRIKKDAVPGRYNKVWFRGTVPGEFTIFCAEYCGTQHSDMLSTVVVHPPGEFEKWMMEAANFVDKLPPAEAGARLYKARGCASCHTVDGRPGIGPSFKGVFGHQAILSSGERVLADEDYVRRSILEPATEVVAGFEPVMPTYKGRIKDKEITALIEYLKTLQ